jgi:hypothetical protein
MGIQKMNEKGCNDRDLENVAPSYDPQFMRPQLADRDLEKFYFREKS